MRDVAIAQVPQADPAIVLAKELFWELENQDGATGDCAGVDMAAIYFLTVPRRLRRPVVGFIVLYARTENNFKSFCALTSVSKQPLRVGQKFAWSCLTGCRSLDRAVNAIH